MIPGHTLQGSFSLGRMSVKGPRLGSLYSGVRGYLYPLPLCSTDNLGEPSGLITPWHQGAPDAASSMSQSIPTWETPIWPHMTGGNQIQGDPHVQEAGHTLFSGKL